MKLKLNQFSMDKILLELQKWVSKNPALSNQQNKMSEFNQWCSVLKDCFENGPSDSRKEVSCSFEYCDSDGLLVGAAALYPVLHPQWKEPRKQWDAIASADGKK